MDQPVQAGAPPERTLTRIVGGSAYGTNDNWDAASVWRPGGSRNSARPLETFAMVGHGRRGEHQAIQDYYEREEEQDRLAKPQGIVEFERSMVDRLPKRQTRRSPGMMSATLTRLHHVVLDCPDPLQLATFYADLLGSELTYRSDDWVGRLHQ